MKWSQWHGLGKVGWSRDGTGLGGKYDTQLSRVRNLIWRLHLRSQWNHRIGWLYCSWQWRLWRATSDNPETTPEEEKWSLSKHLHQHTPTSGRSLSTADHWPRLRGSNSVIRRWHRLHIFNKSLCVTTWNTSGPKHFWTQSAGVHCFSTHEMLLYTSYLTSLFSFLSDGLLTKWPHELCGRLNRKTHTNDKCQAY